MPLPLDPNRLARQFVIHDHVPQSQEEPEWQRMLRRWWGQFLHRVLGDKRPLSHVPGLASVPHIEYIGLALFVLLLIVGAAVVLRVRSSTTKSIPTVRSSRAARTAKADEIFSLAQQHAGDGRFRQAAALVFQASVALGSERALVERDDALTPHEYERRVATVRAELQPAIAEISRAAVEAVYNTAAAEQGLWENAAHGWSYLRTRVDIR